jgi:5-methylcytosine-specific restriction endonuclease McrA
MALNGALNGEVTPLSPFLAGPFDRLDAHEWHFVRSQVFERDDYTCTYCGARGVKLECDHIIPVAKGGEHDLYNLTTACKPCNRSKAAKSLDQWRAERGAI